MKQPSKRVSLSLFASAVLVAACSSGAREVSSSHGNADTQGNVCASTFTQADVCGSPGDSTGAATSDTQTGVGNRFHLVVDQVANDNDGTSYTFNYLLRLSYTNTTGYMNDSTTGQPPTYLTAWLGVTATNRNTDGTTCLATNGNGDTVTLYPQADGSFLGTDCNGYVMSGQWGYEGQLLSAVDVAFAGPNGQWDSNDGANYHVVVGQ